MIKVPTPEEVAKLKTIAIAKFGNNRMVLIELDDPVNAAVVMAPHDAKSWAKMVDAQARDLYTSHAQTFGERLLWPSIEEGLTLRDRWPAVPTLIARRMLIIAGQVPEDAIVKRLDVEAPPAGLSKEQAVALVKEHAGSTLWSVEHHELELSCVMKAPLPDIYLAMTTANNDARAKGIGIVSSTEQYLFEAVIWSARPIAAVVDQRPALIGELKDAFLKMGGEGAAVRYKSL